MTDEGRLELDDAGEVVDRSGTPSTLVDLADPDATDALAATPLDSWASRSAAPWVRARRGPVAAVVAGALVLALGGAWWASRPAPPPPPPALVLADAPVVGADLGGPRITAGGTLSVAYSARADPSLPTVDVLGLRGPGLAPTGVEAGAATIPGGALAFVQLGAAVDCTDRALADATSSSYGLLVRTPGTGPGEDRLVAFGDSTTELDVAIRDACLADDLPTRVSVVSGDLGSPPGSSVVDLSLQVWNSSELPLTVATQRTPNTSVESDLSPSVLVAPHSGATVPTRLLVHDCAAPARPPALADLPGAVRAPGFGDPARQAGITVRIGLGDRWTLASYALPWTVDALTSRIAATACAGRPEVAARLTDVRGTHSTDGSWLVTGVYDVSTSGVGVALGREHFTGSPFGDGSTSTTTDALVPGVRWVLAPTQLDGGAGRLPVTFSGESCDDLGRGIPASMAVRVTTADRLVYPFELPLDRGELQRALAVACSARAAIQVPGWTRVTTSPAPLA